MAWVYANDNTPYDGPTHNLAGITYTGATRKPGTKRLLFIADAEVKPSKKKPAAKKAKSNGSK
jgi:hypothetical protein